LKTTPPYIHTAQPFVLLDDARVEGAADARLFCHPLEVAIAMQPAEVPALLATIDRWQAQGALAAGFLAYEAGHALDAKLAGFAAPLADGWPLGWFARFARCERIVPDAVPSLLPDPAGAWVSAPRPQTDFPDYVRMIETVLEHIRAGDIYQANVTFAASVAIQGDPLAAYARLRASARAGYGGVVWTGTHWLLSLSPELFFSLREGRIVARPMKGTASRLPDPAADAATRADLASDPKQRAENLMIVDLIRNDLSRIAIPGSVAVPALFRVESYPTIHQMVSDVTASVAPDTGIGTILSAIFPCGSITGAPKLSAMAIIDQLETGRRGAYTGSIGFIAPGGEAAFNVAIRTLALRDGDACATVGLGSGIVADSVAAAEWQECLAKGDYIRVAGSSFDLLETMRFDPRDGIARLDRHLERMAASARSFGFAFDRHLIRNRLQQATFRQKNSARVRMRLSPAGNIAIALDPLPTQPDGPVRVAIAPLPVASADFRLRHKTSDRAFYDEARAASGAFETLFEDADGLLTEGSFTALFVEREGHLLTPPLARGLIPGVLRAELLAEDRAVEQDLTRADLANGFLIGNSLRGLIPAILL
jgi:para-aminobenzoate synthetase / 4-amino-4-deoxychorismate lyase